MVEVKDLVKNYGNRRAVDHLSFTVGQRQAFGFLGTNGSGKSTTMNILAGFLPATSGEVTIHGFDIRREPKRAKRCIGYLPEIPPVYKELTPLEYLRFAGQARGIPRRDLDLNIGEAMEKTGLTGVKRQLIHSLSKGYQQRVGIAQAILGNPEIIILDEPTVGLDPRQIADVRALIQELKKEHTVIFSSHMLSEVASICDRILIISHGKLVALDDTENIRTMVSDRAEYFLTVRQTDSAAALEAVALLGDVQLKKPVMQEDGYMRIAFTVPAGVGLQERLVAVMLEKQCPFFNLTENETSLENAFLKLIGSRQGETEDDA